MNLQPIIKYIENLNNKSIIINKFNKKQNIDLLNLLSNNINSLEKLNITNSFSLQKTFIKNSNPFFILRKNFKKFFLIFIKGKTLTPNVLKFLHILLFPKNIENIWKRYYNIDALELIKFKYKKQNFIPLNNFQYFFSLIYKDNYIKKLNFFNIKSHSIYNKKLKYLYYLSSFNNKNKINIFALKTPNFIQTDRTGKNFSKFFILSFKDKIYLKKVIQFYYPLFSLLIKEKAIHSLPMKTKKPRRV